MSAPVMPDLLLAFRARELAVEMHHHAAMQLVYAEDQAFSATIDGIDYEQIIGFFILPQVPHRCHTEQCRMVIINIEPDSQPAALLLDVFQQRQSVCIIRSHSELLGYFKIPGCSNVSSLASQLLHYLSPQQAQQTNDPRIKQVIEHIRNDVAAPLNPRALSADVFLSHSRFSALFKQQTGSSISKFVLWTRLRHAVHLLLAEKALPLTSIALNSGFYDLPNLDKYMVAMLGLPPFILRKNSNLIQVLDA